MIDVDMLEEWEEQELEILRLRKLVEELDKRSYTGHMVYCPDCNKHLTSLLLCPECGSRYKLVKEESYE